MALSGNFRPTLLVGLGGTGSKIAEDILAQVRKNDPELISRIGIVAIDTDKNDLSDLEHVPEDAVIQISRPETVHRMLERNSEVETTWCYGRNDPEMSQPILSKSLIEGAGQIRMLTRLALHDSFVNQGMLGKLESAISDLAVHGSDNNYDGAIHVLMFGSLAGATGSGSFAQIALAISQAAGRRDVHASVRGVFLLPDIYARSGELKTSQEPNVLANGYASLKELNAINVRAQLPQRKAKFKFEYLPGTDLQDGSQPFAAVTFIDRENSRGGSMGNDIKAYVRMAARAGYLLIFSPLGARYGSDAINDVRQELSAIAAGSTNLYSGIGVSAVTYPIESMRKYLSRRFVLENLKGDWTRLDKAYLDQVARFQQEQKTGATSSEAPDLRKTFIKDLSQLAREEPRLPFFRKAYSHLFPEVEDERTRERKVRPLHENFIDELTNYVSNSFWNDDDMKGIRQRPSLDSSVLIESDGMASTVRIAESDLDRDFRAVEAALQNRPKDIFQNSLVSADSLAEGEFAAHQIQSYIVDSAMHPVAVRAFLYHTRAELVSRRGNIDEADLRKKLFSLANVFRDDDEIEANGKNPPNRSTPRVLELAAKIDELTLISDPLGRKKRGFAEQYSDYFNSTNQRTVSYANATISALIFDDALAEIDNFIRVFEELFREIEETSSALEDSIDAETKAYIQGRGYDGNTFVYADRACKEDAWQKLQEVSAGLSLDDQINKSLVSSVYKKHREDKSLRRESSFKEINQLFWDKVVIGFGEKTIERDFSSFYDFSVMSAMKREYAVREDHANKEAERAGKPRNTQSSQSSFIKSTVGLAANQSEPYLSFLNPDSDGSAIKFWSIHPQAEVDLNDAGLFGDIFRAGEGSKPIVEDEFSKYELICFNLRANVELQMLAKLQMPDGEGSSVLDRKTGRYAAAYKKMVQAMLMKAPDALGGEFTPHVDKKWHIPGELPEIFVDVERRIRGGNSKAYVVARILGLITLENSHNQRVARFSSLGHALKNPQEVDFSESHDPWDVYTDFCLHVPLVNSSLEYWEKSKSVSGKVLTAHPDFVKLTNPELIFPIFQASAVRGDQAEDRDQAARECLVSWMQAVFELVAAQETSLPPKAQKAFVQEHIETVRDALFSHIVDNEYPAETNNVFKRNIQLAFDTYFSG